MFEIRSERQKQVSQKKMGRSLSRQGTGKKKKSPKIGKSLAKRERVRDGGAAPGGAFLVAQKELEATGGFRRKNGCP